MPRGLKRTSSPDHKPPQAKSKEAILEGSQAPQGHQASKDWPKAAQEADPHQPIAQSDAEESPPVRDPGAMTAPPRASAQGLKVPRVATSP
jgi:hypothetical protein